MWLWRGKNLTGFEPGVNCKTKSPHIENTETDSGRILQTTAKCSTAPFFKVSWHQLDEGRQGFDQNWLATNFLVLPLVSGASNPCREPGLQGAEGVLGGGFAGTRDREPYLAPAGRPLAWPLPPTGGDALNVCENVHHLKHQTPVLGLS